MEIHHQTDGNRGSFFIQKEGERLADMVYKMVGPNKMVIEHTEVDLKLKGQGVGVRLLEHLVEFVRKDNIKVVPFCPFAKATFRKREDLQDVLN